MHLRCPGAFLDTGGNGVCDIEFQVHAACGMTYSPSVKSTLEVHVLVKGPHGGRITERERHRERVVTERERERERERE